MHTPPAPVRRLLWSPAAASLLALVAGASAGTLLGRADFSQTWEQLLLRGSEAAGFTVLTFLRALAVPIIVCSAVLGGMGLEAMRGLGRLAAKMAAWIVGSSLLAALVAVALSRWPGLGPLSRMGLGGAGDPRPLPGLLEWNWGWPGLVGLALATAYYRNQVEEGQGRLLMRFCLALEGMWTPLLRWTRVIVPPGVFFLAAAAATIHAPLFHSFVDQGFTRLLYLHRNALFLGLVTMLVYPLLLSAGVWSLVRVNVWRSVGSLLPAVCLAAAGQSVEGALPLTYQAVRSRAGISNRVAGVVLPLGAILHRDGLALMWAWALLCTRMQDVPGLAYGRELAGVMLLTWLVGAGLGGLSGGTRLVPLLCWGEMRWAEGVTPVLLMWFASSVGGAISVFSQYCAAIVIARSEGEYWVPGPPPSADELQELKTSLDSAEG